MKSTTGVQLLGLDHVRAFAALLVFMWHFSHPPFGATPFGYVPNFFALSIFNEGHTGVALFMTLSGFLFSYLSFGKEIQLGQFYKNRFLRVFPLLFFWCIYGVAFQNYSASEVAANLLSLLDNKVPAGGWTVLIEAQFYLLFPFMHTVIEKKYRKTGLRGVASYVFPMLGLMLVLRWGTWVETGSAQVIAYWTIFGRLDEFIMGVFFFYVFKSKLSNWSPRKSAIALAILAAVFLIFWRWFNIRGGYANYGSYPSPARIWIVMPTIEGVFYATFIPLYLSVSRGFGGPVARLISNVGNISYSIYLANFFVIPLLERLHTKIPFTHTEGFGEYFAWGMVVGFPLICAFATLTYNFVEKPFLERRKRYV